MADCQIATCAWGPADQTVTLRNGAVLLICHEHRARLQTSTVRPGWTPADEKELFWWRHEFACRFLTDNLPHRDTALHGARFILMVENPVTHGLDPWRPSTDG